MNCQLLTLRRTLSAVIVVLLVGFPQVVLLAACGPSQPTATPARTVAVPPTATVLATSCASEGSDGDLTNLKEV